MPDGPPIDIDKDALSYCPKDSKCRIARLLEGRAEVKREVDDMLVMRTAHSTIIEFLAVSRGVQGVKKWDLSRHSKHLLAEREEKKPVEEQPKDPAQKAISDAEYRSVTLQVPAFQFDRARKLDTSTDVNEAIQMLKHERDRVFSLTRTVDVTKAQGAIRLWKDICAELRLWEELARTIEIIQGDSKEMEMGQFYAKLNEQRAKKKDGDKKD